MLEEPLHLRQTDDWIKPMIRMAAPEDVPRINSCATEAYEKYVQRIGKKPAPMVADFASLVNQGHVFVSTGPAGEIEGFIVFYARRDHMHLENVAVYGNCEGKGVGRRLIEFCEATALKKGLDRVELYTNEKMTENLTLYPHLGYVETSRKQQDGFNRVFFQKHLR